MNYTQALEYLDQLNTKGINYGLESVRKLASVMGNPQDNMFIVHIAGTNGKGSVGSYISNILICSGLKVGIYQSPAVFDEREIIRYNNKLISKAKWAEAITTMSEKISENNLTPSRFEFETVLMWYLLKEKGCDILVMECGMGGALDATNIAKGNICVFTPIDYDHMAFLGDTLKEIAGNKAGIIKPGSVAVSSYQCKEVEEALDEKASFAKTSVEYVDLKQIKNVKKSLNRTTFDYKDLKKASIVLKGDNQVENAALSYECVKALRNAGIEIPPKAIYKGLENTVLEGRFEVICNKPLVILDGAHNPNAARRLKENIEFYCKDKKIIFILSMLKDKEYDKVVTMMCGIADHVLTVNSPNKARTLDAFSLAKCVSTVNKMVTAVDSIEEAVEISLLMADKDTAIIAWGSLSHLNKVKECVDNRSMIKKDTHAVEEING